MMPTMSEADCAICAEWPPVLRAAMRQTIDRVTMKGWVCDDCVLAFWDNCWRGSEERRAREAEGDG
jgi:hypothetical protein